MIAWGGFELIFGPTALILIAVGVTVVFAIILTKTKRLLKRNLTKYGPVWIWKDEQQKECIRITDLDIYRMHYNVLPDDGFSMQKFKNFLEEADLYKIMDYLQQLLENTQNRQQKLWNFAQQITNAVALAKAMPNAVCCLNEKNELLFKSEGRIFCRIPICDEIQYFLIRNLFQANGVSDCDAGFSTKNPTAVRNFIDLFPLLPKEKRNSYIEGMIKDIDLSKPFELICEGGY